MVAEVRQFTCLSDNFGVLVHDPDADVTVAFDVPEAQPYLDVLKETGWKLNRIFLTHHHWDHVQGLAELKEKTGARVTGPALSHGKISGMDGSVEDDDDIREGNWEFKALATPGHTLDHLTWWLASENIAHTGDTLFSLGCGRIFEGDPEMMWASLVKLARRLPGETRLFCGHEYTQSNAAFALSVDPDNEALQARAADVERLRSAGEATLPTTMAQELATNPFLRAKDPAIRKLLGMEDAENTEVFAEIRRRKDNFR